jgi:hypothetical protein
VLRGVRVFLAHVAKCGVGEQGVLQAFPTDFPAV